MSNDRMIIYQVVEDDRQWSWPILRHYPTIYLEHINKELHEAWLLRS
jgi:hypothetical protein